MNSNTEPLAINEDYLMNKEEQLFFLKYRHEDINQLSLKLKTTARQKDLLKQISSRQKIKAKLPSFYQNLQIYYPPQISLEQCSSEKTAQFKSTLVSGHTLLDLTAGMGIDSFFLGKKFSHVIMVEAGEALAGITSHNLATFAGTGHMHMVKGITAEHYLKQYAGDADLIYLDPGRRDQAGGKVVRLQDCAPDVISLLPLMFSITRRVMLKTSPLLDISLACSALKNVRNVFVLEWLGECRELLFEIERDYTDDYQIHAVNLDDGSDFAFYSMAEKQAQATYSMPLKFLYEPHACILKAGAFNEVHNRFDVFKLHPHTHLYTSAEAVSSFPGRTFEIYDVCKATKSALQKSVPGIKANITIRNFPDTVAGLRKKLGISDGGDIYLFASTLCNAEKAVLVCKKVK